MLVNYLVRNFQISNLQIMINVGNCACVSVIVQHLIKFFKRKTCILKCRLNKFKIHIVWKWKRWIYTYLPNNIIETNTHEWENAKSFNRNAYYNNVQCVKRILIYNDFGIQYAQ